MALPQYRKMICLVGENPLPIYLCIRKLSTADAEIVLLSSENGTKPIAKKISKQVKKDNGSYKETRTCKIETIMDPYDPLNVDAFFERYEFQQDSSLNITGGTKVMSAFSVPSWKGGRKDIFYLEDSRRKVHFGNGVTEDIGDVDLSIQIISSLHGIELHPRKHIIPVPPLNEIVEFYQSVYKRHQCYFKYEENHENNFGSFLKYKTMIQSCMSAFSAETIRSWNLSQKNPSNEANYKESSWRDALEFFALNEWFECLIYQMAKEILKSDDIAIPDSDIAFRTECASSESTTDPQMFEGDIFLVCRNRLRYISVTTASKASICKEKMFEAMHRSRQIGGDMATSCVISLANANIVQSCNKSVDEIRHTIFGRQDLEMWINGNRDSLKRFLTGDYI